MTSNSLAALSDLAEQQAALEEQIIETEQVLAILKKRHTDIAEERLPALMEELEIDKFETRSGLKIDVKEKVRAHINKANQAAAFKWLYENGHEHLIKNEVKVQLLAGEDDLAERVATAVSDAAGREPERKLSVHSGTLSAWVREMMENGEDIPTDILGVFRQRTAKIEFSK